MTVSSSGGPNDALAESQWRRCPFTGRWVVVAQVRAGRPMDFAGPAVSRKDAFCPFCGGNEEFTTAELAARRDPATPANAPGWRVRALPNKYPAVLSQVGGAVNDHALFTSQPGVGVHEVFVESPEHFTSSSQLSAEQFADVLWVYRERLCAVRQDTRLRYGLVFKNVGALSGASLEHLHSQLLATPMLPATISDELASGASYYQRQQRCLFCDVIAAELAAGERIVAATDDWVAFCPYASRFSWETWILPRQHQSDFTCLTDGQLGSLGRFLRQILGQVEATLPLVSYNYLLHTSPFDTLALEHYHWHLEILPRVTSVAGFEWGAGFAINTLSPEKAADMLRQAP